MSKDMVLTALLDRLERELNDWSEGEAARAILGDAQRWVALSSEDFVPELSEFLLSDVLQAVGDACGVGQRVEEGVALTRWGDREALASLLRTFIWSFAPARIHHVEAVAGLEDPLVCFRVVAESLPAAHPSPYLDSLGSALNAKWSGGELTLPLALREEDADPPVDVEFFTLSTFNDPVFERELTDAFREEAARQLETLRHSFTQATVHSLRGSAALLGAKRLARLLENQEKSLDPGALGSLEAEFERVLRWIERRLPKQ